MKKNKKELSEIEKFFKIIDLYLIILIVSYGILFGMAIYLKLKGF